MIEFDNRYGIEFDLKVLKEIKDDLSDKDIELIFTNSDEIQEINKNFRGIDKPTDVLSFPLDFMPGLPLGSVVINIDFAKNVSEKLGHSLDEEITLLFIHGLLHLLGYDHESDEGEMPEKEEELIKKYDLPKSLIVRNSSDS